MAEPSKIFVIGMFKTGLPTLHVALWKMGLKVFMNNPCYFSEWWLKDIEASVEKNPDATKFYPDIIEGMKGFDVGIYHPFMYIYPWLDVTFPGSKFLLTQRDVTGVIKTTSDQSQNFKDITISETKVSDRYLSHQASVMAYFKDNPNLLAMNFDTGDGWNKLCSFLGTDIPQENFPASDTGDFKITP